jgi:hypothetical protein
MWRAVGINSRQLLSYQPSGKAQRKDWGWELIFADTLVSLDVNSHLGFH